MGSALLAVQVYLQFTIREGISDVTV